MGPRGEKKQATDGREGQPGMHQQVSFTRVDTDIVRVSDGRGEVMKRVRGEAVHGYRLTCSDVR